MDREGALGIRPRITGSGAGESVRGNGSYC
jgi:hypothetical protein